MTQLQVFILDSLWLCCIFRERLVLQHWVLKSEFPSRRYWPWSRKNECVKPHLMLKFKGAGRLTLGSCSFSISWDIMGHLEVGKTTFLKPHLIPNRRSERASSLLTTSPERNKISTTSDRTTTSSTSNYFIDWTSEPISDAAMDNQKTAAN